ncbi:ATP-binding protein [Actinoplanes sp. NBRC 103695]|uniref:two-component system sensor histidine kinase NtrB n=1 Tax=Actinoplanes sp. NBRC 103695 TaxID=3032202 RepID=UPI0025568A1D|nr:ATP-binding protein [Actinoplanes sp. NBRC 103695]
MRLLFLVFCLIWAAIGFYGADADSGVPRSASGAAIVVVEASLVVGYRRGRFPWWTWLVELPCVGLVAFASGYKITIGLLFVWINFRALYGSRKDQLPAAAAVVAVMAGGVFLAGVPSSDAVSLTVTALIGLAINHTLAQGLRARDRAAARESVVASAGAAFAAVGSRQEAAQAAAGAALRLDEAVGGALLTTIASSAVRIIGHAGSAGPDVLNRSIELDDLGPEMLTALSPGGTATITGAAAAGFAAAMSMPAHDRLLVVPLAVQGDVFGLLVAAVRRRPDDDLSAALLTLADEAALTLDRLLSRSRLSIVVENSSDALILAGELGVIRLANPAAERLLGHPVGGLAGRDLRRLIHPQDLDVVLTAASTGARTCRLRGSDDQPWSEYEVVVEYVTEHDGSRSLILNARDISEQRRLEMQLRHAQKLESVGRLAAGVAHEINTPIQFVGDNIRFLDGSFADLLTLVTAVRDRGDSDEAMAELLREIDAEFLLREVPAAVRQTLEGVDRVATIVRAMKSFGHPGDETKSLADLNDLVTNTLVVAAGEIKPVADVETELADLPPVRCHVGDINQTLLNLVVNAAHAIEAAGKGRGTVRVVTRRDGDEAVIDVADTGTGVPPEVADKLFDPFFTTKEVGRGTGQGLALARSLVVDRHQGSISFHTEIGAGTVFSVRLPIGEAAGPAPSSTELEVVP